MPYFILNVGKFFLLSRRYFEYILILWLYVVQWEIGTQCKMLPLLFVFFFLINMLASRVFQNQTK